MATKSFLKNYNLCSKRECQDFIRALERSDEAPAEISTGREADRRAGYGQGDHTQDICYGRTGMTGYWQANLRDMIEVMVTPGRFSCHLLPTH